MGKMKVCIEQESRTVEKITLRELWLVSQTTSEVS